MCCVWDLLLMPIGIAKRETKRPARHGVSGQTFSIISAAVFFSLHFDKRGFPSHSMVISLVFWFFMSVATARRGTHSPVPFRWLYWISCMLRFGVSLAQTG